MSTNHTTETPFEFANSELHRPITPPVADRLIDAVEFRVIRPGAPVRRLRLTGNRYTFGSADGCSIRLNDPALRPMHAVLIRDAHRILVRAYSVPLVVNGVRTTEAILALGDVMRMGAYRFELLSAPSSVVAAAGSLNTQLPKQDDQAWQEQLRREAAQWRARQIEFDARESRCDHREVSLQGRESELWNRAEHLRRRETELISQESAIIHIREEFETKRQEVSRLREENRARQQEIDRRDDEYRELEGEYREYARQAKQQLEHSQRQAQTATEAVQKMRDQFAALNEQLEQFSKQQQELEEARNNAIDAQSQSETRRQQAEQRVIEISAELESILQQKEREQAESEAQRQHAEQRVAELSTELESIVERKECERASSDARWQQAEQRVAEIAAELESIRQQKERAQTESEAVRQQAEQRVAEIAAELDSIRQQKERAQTESEAVRQQAEQRVAEISAELESIRQQKERAQTESEAVRQQAEQRVAEISAELESIRQQKERDQAQRQQAEQRVAEISAELESIRVQKEQEQAQRQLAEQRVAEISAELDSIRSLKEGSHAKLSESEQATERLQQQVTQLQQRIDEASSEAAQLRSDYEDALASVRQLELLVDQTTTKGQHDRASWVAEADELRKTVEQLSVDLANANGELSDLREANATLTRRLVETEQQRDVAQADAQSRPSSEALAVVREELDSAIAQLEEMRREHEVTLQRLAEQRQADQNATDQLLDEQRERDRKITEQRLAEAIAERDAALAAANQSIVSAAGKGANSELATNDSDHSWPTYKSGSIESQDLVTRVDTDLVGAVSSVQDLLAEPQSRSTASSESRSEDTEPESSAVERPWGWHCDAEEATSTESNDQPLIDGSLDQAHGDSEANTAEAEDTPNWRFESEQTVESSGHFSAWDGAGEPEVDPQTEFVAQDDDVHWHDEAPEVSVSEMIDDIEQNVDQAITEADSPGTAWNSVDVREESPQQSLWRQDDTASEESSDDSWSTVADDGGQPSLSDEPESDSDELSDHALSQMLIRDLEASESEQEPDANTHVMNRYSSLDPIEEYEATASWDHRSLARTDELGDEPTESTCREPYSADTLAGNDVTTDEETLQRESSEVADETPQSDSPGHEDSIEEYMNRLLQRVQGDDPRSAQMAETSTLTATSITKVDQPDESAAEDTTPLDVHARLIPRSQAPERDGSLSAMRELANHSARSAVSRSVRIQARDTQLKGIVKFGQAGVAMACAAACLLFLDWGFMLRTIAILAILIIAGILAQEGFVLLIDARRRMRIADEAAAGTSNGNSDFYEPIPSLDSQSHAEDAGLEMRSETASETVLTQTDEEPSLSASGAPAAEQHERDLAADGTDTAHSSARDLTDEEDEKRFEV